MNMSYHLPNELTYVRKVRLSNLGQNKSIPTEGIVFFLSSPGKLVRSFGTRRLPATFF